MIARFKAGNVRGRMLPGRPCMLVPLGLLRDGLHQDQQRVPVSSFSDLLGVGPPKTVS